MNYKLSGSQKKQQQRVIRLQACVSYDPRMSVKQILPTALQYSQITESTKTNTWGGGGSRLGGFDISEARTCWRDH